MSDIPKAALYYYKDSVWASVAILALEEKGYGSDEIDLKHVDLSKGENYAPSYLRLNPNETLAPEIEHRYKAIQDTKSIVEFLDRSRSTQSRTHTTSTAPSPSLAPATIAFSTASNNIIDILHGLAADPNALAYMNARNEAELRTLAIAVLPRLTDRRDALTQLLKDSEEAKINVSAKTKAFWELKKLSVDRFIEVLEEANKSVAELNDDARKRREDFLQGAKTAWTGLKDTLMQLHKEIIGPYTLGDQLSVADLHLAAWLARIAHLSGATVTQDGNTVIAKIEAHIGDGFSLPKDFSVAEARRRAGLPSTNVEPTDCQNRFAAFWDAVKERPSWKKVECYGERGMIDVSSDIAYIAPNVIAVVAFVCWTTGVAGEERSARRVQIPLDRSLVIAIDSDHSSKYITLVLSHVPLSPIPLHQEVYDENAYSDAGPSVSSRSSGDLRGRTSVSHHRSSISSDFDEQAPSRLSEQLVYPSDAEGTYAQSTLSLCSTASNTPLPSRSASPHHYYFSGTSSCSSESESEPESLILGRPRRQPLWREARRRRWWTLSTSGREGHRHRRRNVMSGVRSFKRAIRIVVRHPFFPKTPVTILLTLLLLTIFGVSLTFLLIYILNPTRSRFHGGATALFPVFRGPASTLAAANSVVPVSHRRRLYTFIVSATELRQFVAGRRICGRVLYGRVSRAQDAGALDMGTSRTVVRFILGQPRKEWERRVRLEMETYNDMVILPVSENMNSGKTHAFFTWAANNSWVPPLYFDNFTSVPSGLSYTNLSSPAPALAQHDPVHARRDRVSGNPQAWVKPDFVVKADDDSFVMLAELEARLRVELHKKPKPPPKQQVHKPDPQEPAVTDADKAGSQPLPPSQDPLVFWGYLVKNRFMAGELYALSYSIVDFVANDPLVKTMIRGAEDKQTSKWVRSHPRAEEVRWGVSAAGCTTILERGLCKRVQQGVMRDIKTWTREALNPETSVASALPFGPNAPTPPTWSHSTVSKFGARYSPPMADMKLEHSVEALVEGSAMSMVHDGVEGAVTPLSHGRAVRDGGTRYQGKRVGGTVVVHFIKKNMWFLETASALLHGDDVTPDERAQENGRRKEVDPPGHYVVAAAAAQSSVIESRLQEHRTISIVDGLFIGLLPLGVDKASLDIGLTMIMTNVHLQEHIPSARRFFICHGPMHRPSANMLPDININIKVWREDQQNAMQQWYSCLPVTVTAYCSDCIAFEPFAACGSPIACEFPGGCRADGDNTLVESGLATGGTDITPRLHRR
ncbi:hypothetical protein A0H81_01075 [Grifola frondosa]|uniref:GST N-terminal domain-containing protein n=1 Tax=Grifola frondosa TaxID=5627 RepID=A0A1C7MWM8_GRIFR|nr:hypothetical protein A0H81_01075 [Grifola frondosa]